jgi:hypothetical protein
MLLSSQRNEPARQAKGEPAARCADPPDQYAERNTDHVEEGRGQHEAQLQKPIA